MTTGHGDKQIRFSRSAIQFSIHDSFQSNARAAKLAKGK
jgi:hypothetical protein